MTTKNFTVDAGVEITGSGNITGANGDITISTANGNAWTFDNTGSTIFPNNTLSTPGNLILQTTDGIPTGVANWNGQGGWNQSLYTDLATTGGSGTGLTVDVAAGGGGYISINQITIHTPGTGYTDGDVITINNENNLPGTFTISVPTPAWTFDTTGTLIVPGGANISNGNLNAGVASATVALNAFSPDGNTVSFQAQGNTSSAVISIFSNAGPVTSNWTFTTAPLDPSESFLYVPNGGAITTPAASGGEGGKNIFIQAGASDPVTWNSNPGGELMLKGGYGSFGDGGGGPGGNVNIEGGPSSDSHTGNVNIMSGGNAWVFDYSGNLTAAGNVIMATGGQIQSGVDTVVTDGINAIYAGATTTMDVFAFPFTTTTRGQLTISGITTPSEANGTWYYQSVNTNTFALYTDNTYSTPVDSSAWAAYTGGGSVAITKQVPASNIVINSNGFKSTFTNNGQLNLPGALTTVGDIGTDGNVSAYNGSFGGNINGTGNFDIDGNANIGGNLFVTGNINFSGNVTQISGNSGVFYGNASTGVGALYAGKTGFTPVANTILQVTGDLDDYIQVNLQNTNHASTASMEIAITADDGNDTDNYIDMGIASSTWNGTQTNSLGTAVAARDGYLYVQGGAAGGNLILGTTTAGYKVKFNAGGPGAANTVATISNTGISTTGTVIATGNITGGNLVTSGRITATGNITGGNITTAGTFQTASLAASGNLTFTSNTSNIVFNNASTIYPDTTNRIGSIVLQPYTGAGSSFPSVIVGGAGRLAAPNGSVHQIFNPSDVTFQVAVKAITGTTSTSTTTGALQITGGAGFTGNIYAGGVANITGNVTVSGTGGISIPNLPAFRVYGNGVTSVSTTTNSTGVLNGNNWTADFNQGSYLNSTTGTFTAPVAGLYQINLQMRVANNTAATAQAIVVKNRASTNVTQVMWESAANPTINHFGVSTVSKLAVGDTLNLVVAVGALTFDQNDNWSVAFLG